MNKSTQKWGIRIVMWFLIAAFIFAFSNGAITSRLIMGFSISVGVLFALYVLLEIEQWKKRREDEERRNE